MQSSKTNNTIFISFSEYIHLYIILKSFILLDLYKIQKFRMFFTFQKINRFIILNMQITYSYFPGEAITNTIFQYMCLFLPSLKWWHILIKDFLLLIALTLCFKQLRVEISFRSNEDVFQIAYSLPLITSSRYYSAFLIPYFTWVQFQNV